MDISEERVARIVGRCTAYSDRPPQIPQSDKMTDAPLAGNGDIGISIAGDVAEQTWHIAKNDFWVQAHVGETWEQRLARLLAHDGDRERRTGTRIIPVGYLDLRVPELAGGRYEQQQDIYRAEIRGEFPLFREGDSLQTCTWVSAVENLIVVELTAGTAGIERLTLDPHCGERGQYERFAESNGVLDDVVWIRYAANSQNVPGRRRVEMAVRVIGPEVVIDDGLFAKPIHFSLAGGETACVVVSLLSDLDEPELVGKAIARVRGLTPDTVAAEKEKHRAWWLSFWRRSSVEFGDPQLEQYYYGSQYILACCTREGKVPPGLYGNWITIDRPKWTGSYTLNYNYQSPFWALFAANHGDLTRSYCDVLLDLIPLGKVFAKKKLGCRGVYLPVEVGPWSSVCSSLFFGQKSNAVYSALNLIMDFYFSWDLEYARKVYPFLIEVAEFWEDYLVLEGDRYVALNDALGEQYDASTDKNPIITLALLRFLLKGIIAVAGELGVDADRVPKWQDMLDRLSDYTTFERNGKTVYRLTESGPDWHEKRGMAALAPIYPSGEVGLGSDPERLQIAYHSFVEQDAWDDFNAFQAFYPAGARVGYDPSVLLQQLRRQCQTRGFPNLQIFHGGGGIEECNGLPGCINEMMLQSHDFTLRLFPVWEDDRDATFVNLRAYGAFLVTSRFADGRVRFAEINSERGRRLRVKNPWPQTGASVYRNGEELPSANDELIEMDTAAGDTILIFSRAEDLEAVKTQVAACV